MSERKAVIKNADMGEEMQQDAVDCATQALEKFNIEKVTYIEGLHFLNSIEKHDEMIPWPPCTHRALHNKGTVTSMKAVKVPIIQWNLLLSYLSNLN